MYHIANYKITEYLYYNLAFFIIIFDLFNRKKLDLIICKISKIYKYIYKHASFLTLWEGAIELVAAKQSLGSCLTDAALLVEAATNWQNNNQMLAFSFLQTQQVKI